MLYYNRSTTIENYGVFCYQNSQTGKIPVLEYIEKLSFKEQVKVTKYIAYLKENKGYLDEPYSKHITGKIRELRVDFSKNKHRIFYFTFIEKKIVLLHAFLKKTKKTPRQEITRALHNLYDCEVNKSFIEYEYQK